MDSELAAPRSRRALLSAAAAAGGALVASAALPMAAMAHDAEDVQKGVDNATTATTSITNTMDVSTAFAAHANGPADPITGDVRSGLEGTSTTGAGLYAWSISGPVVPDYSFLSYTGVYGFAPFNPDPDYFSAGVWGDSEDAGVYGSGYWGVFGYGFAGVEGYANGETGSAGVVAIAPSTGTALYVSGKVHFSRSGRVAMSSGKASKAVTLAGATAGSKIFAVLATSETGRYVRAVVPAAGKFTIYLNTTLASAAVVSWFALD